MPYVIRLIAVEGQIIDRANSDSLDSASGRYVARFDPEAHDGHGALEVTSYADQATTFETFEAAHEYWSSSHGPARGARMGCPIAR